ncbi:MAG: SDR family NAD(P)-dependent oxidoreductase [Sandaracinaceae bacterium]|nr:SDR family NAD(P)-dependent oxidoreductase [Sandaracinaceae bacterium]
MITGANTGVGRATAEALASPGTHLVLACRSRARAEAVLASIGGRARADVVELELGDLASVRRAAGEIAALAPRIDALINNAGVGGARGVTRDGFELAFGVNHLGHYLLTRLLLHRCARVVHVTSGSHERARGLDFEALRRPTRSLTGLPEYAVSKLCTMLFHHELARRGVFSVAADPGDVASDGWRHVPWPIRPLLTCRMRVPAEGARTSVQCATEASIVPGRLYHDGRERAPSERSLDPELARELLARCDAWVGVPDRVGAAA